MSVLATWTHDMPRTLLRDFATVGLMAEADSVVIEAGGHEVTLTHPDKVLFPERGETKLDLARYSEAVAGPRMNADGGRTVRRGAVPHRAGSLWRLQHPVPR